MHKKIKKLKNDIKVTKGLLLLTDVGTLEETLLADRLFKLSAKLYTLTKRTITQAEETTA